MSKSISKSVSISSNPGECDKLNHLPDQGYVGNISRIRSCCAKAVHLRAKQNTRGSPSTRTFKIQFLSSEGVIVCEHYTNLDTNIFNGDPELEGFSFKTEENIHQINIIKAYTQDSDKYANEDIELCADYEIVWNIQ